MYIYICTYVAAMDIRISATKGNYEGYSNTSTLCITAMHNSTHHCSVNLLCNCNGLSIGKAQDKTKGVSMQ